MSITYNGSVVSLSSKFDNLADLVQRLDSISVIEAYRTPDLMRRGLFTPEFSADKRIIYVRGRYGS